MAKEVTDREETTFTVLLNGHVNKRLLVTYCYTHTSENLQTCFIEAQTYQLHRDSPTKLGDEWRIRDCEVLSSEWAISIISS